MDRIAHDPLTIETATAMKAATLAGGCFWCLEAAFLAVRGVSDVVSGYTGGEDPDPTYDAVCTGQTGHAEAVRITFDPRVVTYTDLLGIFLTIHDPTTENRQGADVGTQYRSAVFYHDEEQHAEAEDAIGRFTDERVWSDPIVTQVVPAEEFYAAEEYHQRYFEKNPHQPYCMVVVAPKLAKLRGAFSSLLLR